MRLSTCTSLLDVVETLTFCSGYPGPLQFEEVMLSLRSLKILDMLSLEDDLLDGMIAADSTLNSMRSKPTNACPLLEELAVQYMQPPAVSNFISRRGPNSEKIKKITFRSNSAAAYASDLMWFSSRNIATIVGKRSEYPTWITFE
jgi:hypothetical protein